MSLGLRVSPARLPVADERGDVDRDAGDDKGISPRAGGGKVAWFEDPDGNTFALESD